MWWNEKLCEQNALSITLLLFHLFYSFRVVYFRFVGGLEKDITSVSRNLFGRSSKNCFFSLLEREKCLRFFNKSGLLTFVNKWKWLSLFWLLLYYVSALLLSLIFLDVELKWIRKKKKNISILNSSLSEWK